MNSLQSFNIYRRSCGDLYVFTTVFGPTGTVAEVDPQHFETLNDLERNLADLLVSRLAASHSKSDITGDEETSDSFLKTVKAKTWNVFYRECDSIRIVRNAEGIGIYLGRWDGRGFYTAREDSKELHLASSNAEVAEQIVQVLKSLE